MSTRSHLLPRAALFAATFVWGTTFVVIQRAIADLPVFHLIAFRFPRHPAPPATRPRSELWGGPGDTPPPAGATPRS